MRLLTLLLLALALTATTTAAQGKTPSLSSSADTAVLVGTIRDALTRAPVAGVIVRRQGAYGFGSRSDSTGAYRLERFPVGTVRLDLYCPTRTFGLGQPLPGQDVAVRGGQKATDLLVPMAKCTEPPLDSLRAEFRGHYRGGFEESSFIPCDEGGVPDPAFAARVRGKRIWVTTTAEARADYLARNPPDTTRAPKVYRQNEAPTYYVRWSGVLAGPGAYGHMGIAHYGLRVEHILEYSETSPPDCPRRRPG